LKTDSLKRVCRYITFMLLQRAAFISFLLCIVTFALVAGLIVRRWAWDQGESIRFEGDINNAFRQGNDARRVGYLDRYDDQRALHEGDDDYELDYGPARLLIATVWSKWVVEKVGAPGADWRAVADSFEPFYRSARDSGRHTNYAGRC